MGTVDDAIIIKGLINHKPIDKEINTVFKISIIYLHLFNLTYQFLIFK